jgi:hypothetical protein
VARWKNALLKWDARGCEFLLDLSLCFRVLVIEVDLAQPLPEANPYSLS